MTNLTKRELTMTNLTNEELTMTNLTNISTTTKTSLVSKMGAELYHNGLNERVALVTAVSYIGAIEYIDDMETFMEALTDGLNITTILVKGHDIHDVIDGEAIMEALCKARYLSEAGVGDRIHEIAALRTEAYAPALAVDGVVRRFGYSKVNHSDLSIEFIHALEATEFTKDAYMESIALQVLGVLGEDNDVEGYVLRGCQKMDTAQPYVSEFKMDDRGRGYQAACHGPNGQASDRSRALMDLHGVPQDYDITLTKKLLMAEIADMVGNVRDAIKELKELGEVQFIIKHDQDEMSHVKKPWSFVKAARIMRELQAGNRPYIGTAVGLDAKCSGPQLGALMVGDQGLAAACGMTIEKLDDAYQIAVQHLEKAGFVGFTRSGIKKAYMGVFYGQGWAAFTDVADLIDEGQLEVVEVLYGDQPANDDTAKAFHKVLVSSFGAKMIGVRNLMRQYGKLSIGRTKHFMPDGFEVAMNYKVKVNALGERIEFGTETPDIHLQNNSDFYKFMNFAMKTKEVHEGDFARNGFVNMIQATDALIARLIVVHLKRLGAKHIISVHDCFRVNITEMHLLEKAIKLAYQDLFGGEFNNSTKDLPHGTDILALYFQGANKQLVDMDDAKMVSQFFDSGKRRMRKINGVPVSDLIDSLGVTYYFAK